MASGKKLTLLGQNLQWFSRRARYFSTHSPLRNTAFVLYTKPRSAANAKLLRDQELPLPGNVTTDQDYALKKAIESLMAVAATDGAATRRRSDLLAGATPHQRQLDVLRAFGRSPADAPADQLECVARDCPRVVQQELSSLFPDLNMRAQKNFSVINFTQQTENDMSAWSAEMELERDVLTAQFVDAATSVCSALKRAGYWADFIDPSSGRPYLGPFTNTTLFETDERYRHFGYEIDDLGCCKVIRHGRFGTRAFVGSVFTTAPVDSAVLRRLLSPTPVDPS